MRRHAKLHATSLLTVTVVLLAACSSPGTTPATALNTVSTSPGSSPTPGGATPAPSTHPTATHPTGTPSTGTHSTGPTGRPPSSAQIVTTIKHHFATNTTSKCPFTDTADGQIEVKTAPVDVTYQFVYNSGASSAPTTIHFDTPGTREVTADYTPPLAVESDITATLRILSPRVLNSETDSYHVTCVPSVGSIEIPTVTAGCPYTTTFSVKLTAPIAPMTATYLWKFTDGTSSGGTVTFKASGKLTTTITSPPTIVPKPDGIGVTFVLNGRADVTTPATAACP